MRIKYTIISIAIISIGAMLFSACNKSDNSIKLYGSIQVNISNEVDGVPIVLDTMLYTNSSGNQYRVDLLKYYVSNFTLVNDKGEETNFHNYHLVDASDNTTNTFSLDSVMNGNYTSIKFYLGIDSARNHTGVQDGDLDPIHGMIWSWNTGYIFFKHEGAYVNSTTGAKNNLMFHYGTDAALSTITLPITKFEMKSDEHKIFIKFNLNKLYADPNIIDFNNDNNHQSTEFSDGKWLSNLRSNFTNSFLFDRVQ